MGAWRTLNETTFYAGQVEVQALIDRAPLTTSFRPDPRFLMNSDFQSAVRRGSV